MVYLGVPVDNDDSAPMPGTGWNYCWTPNNNSDSGNLDILDYANAHVDPNSFSAYTMPAGNYAAAGAWTDLLGATLNGTWSIQVTDEWPSDNGYIFSWTIAFDPTILSNCSTIPIQ